MRNLGLFILVILIAVACAGAGVYYLIPNVPGGHILLFSISGNPNTYHLKHALVCFGLAILALLAVRFVQPLPPEKIKTRRLAESTAKSGNQTAGPDKKS
jgi:uncharacterized membrane protein